MDKISIMISSLVSGLEAERAAVVHALQDLQFVDLVGVDPVNNTAVASSAKTSTILLARSCDLYILILGDKFGTCLTNGKSATEIEFDAALKADPTKILVFQKNPTPQTSIDPQQQNFINKVCNYYTGYWRTTFNYPTELEDYVKNSFITWLKKRAALGESLDYIDHFIRLAKQQKPDSNALVYYKTTDSFLELTYTFLGRSYSIQFDISEIRNNFWGCLSSLEDQFITWG